MRTFLLVLAGMLLLALPSLAQQLLTIKGRVTDETGKGMLGVSVSLPGGKTGTVTDPQGAFTILVPPDVKTLKVSFVGFETQTLAIKNNTPLQVVLIADTKAISEVVVVGYGTQRRKEVTGSIASVRGGAVAELPVQSFEAGLGGRAAGVQITVPNGIVNNPPVFRIRGANSLSISAYPLIVIDGVPTFTSDVTATYSAAINPLSSINPADIASIDIAKDAAATAIYGSRAANGVVFVTTKKGKAGRPKVGYDGWVGTTQPTRLPSVLNSAQYLEIKNEGLKNAGSTDRYVANTDANGNMIDTKWMDIVYRKSTFSQNHSVNVAGGNEGGSYYFSAGYTKQQGILERNDFARKNLLFNIDQRLGKAFTLGGRLSYSNELSQISGSSGSLEGEAFNSGGLGRLAFLTAPLVAPFNSDGSYNASGSGMNGGKNTLSVAIYNPKILLDLDHSIAESNHMQGNVYLQLKPVNWLTLKTQYGADYLITNNDIYQNYLGGDAYSSHGDASSIHSQYKRWVWTNTAQLDHSFGLHNLGLLLGNEQQRDARERYGLERQNQMDNYFNNTGGGWLTDLSRSLLRRENYLLSNFVRLNYNFKEKYFLSANVRQDQYSAFGPNYKKGTFYGFSAGWEITKENFWSSAGLDHVFSSFKIRGSHGKVGNFAGIGDFDALSLYRPVPYGGNPSIYFNQAGNANLSWETSKKTDVGFTYGLLKDRVTGEFSYYYNNIDGLILLVPQMPSAGIPSSGTIATIPTNVGSMYNKGIEFSVNAAVVEHKAFTWNASFNIAYNKNEVTSLAGNITSIPFITSSLEQTSINQVGYPASMLYVVRTAGVDAGTGRRIFINAQGEQVYFSYSDAVKYQYADGKPAPTVGVKDAVPYKNTNPKILGGFENTFRYKGFELNVLLTYQAGFYVYYGSNAGLRDQRYWNNSTDVLNRWQKSGDHTDVPRVVYGDNISNGSSFAIAANVFKGDFVKLNTVGLSYGIPENMIKSVHLTGARVYVRGQNLALLTKYPGPDPEVSSNGNNASGQGIDRNTIGNGRTLTIGFNVNF
ncbi:SusC/RagA family TonB-linked outer membrane protein [Chitinophaga sp. 30R24]|uniref:SusC/RagA family TonB-linked outer membrane protein n=1 Tax=Chitinophaga sp. 30R24 TaxID=3248838 RepID=UPI003B913B1D